MLDYALSNTAYTTQKSEDEADLKEAEEKVALKEPSIIINGDSSSYVDTFSKAQCSKGYIT